MRVRDPLLFGLCAVWLLLPDEAFAYIDVGAGSALLQAGIASVLAFLYLVKLRWATLKAWMRGRAPATGADAERDRTPPPSTRPTEDETR